MRPVAFALPAGTLRLVLILVLMLALSVPASRRAFADEPPPPRASAAELSPDTSIDIATAPPEPTAVSPPAPGELAEAPPMRPRHKGLVACTSLGVLGFAGEFRHVAPPGPWLDATLGYELLGWLMIFAEGELAFTTTSESEDSSHAKAFPIWGFGGGLRATVHATDRVAFYGQAGAGALTALVPHDALAILGYRSAETPSPQVSARVGIEWYQVDRHMALTASVGGRLATGFSRILTSNDTPLMWDTAAGLRYAF